MLLYDSSPDDATTSTRTLSKMNSDDSFGVLYSLAQVKDLTNG